MDLYAHLERLGGVRPGHTLFRTGDHGDGWIEKGALFSDPQHLVPVVEAQAEAVAREFPDAAILVGSGECGAALAAMVAARLKRRFAVTLPDDAGALYFHRMFAPEPGAKVAFVDDLIFSGLDVCKHIAFFAASGLRLAGVSAWCVRKTADTGLARVRALMEAPFATFDPARCPDCLSRTPLLWRGVRE